MMRWLFLFILIVPTWISAADARLYLVGNETDYTVGQAFSVEVLLDTDTEVNAAEAEIVFDPELSLESISRAGSIVGSWPTPPEIASDTRAVRFSGWLTDPFRGDGGKLLTLNFRAKAVGKPAVVIAGGSALSHLERGSNIASELRPISFTIIEKDTQPTFEPLPEDSGANVLGATASSPPRFTTYATMLSAGDYIAVRGIARPDTIISLWVRTPHGAEIESMVRTDENGIFSFTTREPAEAGVYRLWGVENLENGEGQSSEKITITVQSRGFALVASAAQNTVTKIFFAISIVLIIVYIALRHRLVFDTRKEN